jgi:regulator of replication initiation timing
MPQYDSQYDGRVNALMRNVESLFTAVNHFEKERAAAAAQWVQIQATLAQLTQDNARLQQEVAVLKGRLGNAGIY